MLLLEHSSLAVLSIQTLFVKAVGVLFSVGGGLTVGKVSLLCPEVSLPNIVLLFPSGGPNDTCWCGNSCRSVTRKAYIIQEGGLYRSKPVA